MTYNTYQLFNTAGKTAVKNNLIYCEYNKAVIDISLLSKLDIDTFIIDDIQRHFRYLEVSNSYIYFGRNVNRFYYFDGIIKFFPLRVYDKDMCQRKYVIFIAQKALITKVKRMSIYTEWERQPMQVEKGMSGYKEEVALYE